MKRLNFWLLVILGFMLAGGLTDPSNLQALRDEGWVPLLAIVGVLLAPGTFLLASLDSLEEKPLWVYLAVRRLAAAYNGGAALLLVWHAVTMNVAEAHPVAFAVTEQVWSLIIAALAALNALALLSVAGYEPVGSAAHSSSEKLRSKAYHLVGHAVAFRRLFPREKYGHELRLEPEDLGFTECLHGGPYYPWNGEAEANLNTLESERRAIYACGGYAAMVAAGYEEQRALENCAGDFDFVTKVLDQPLDSAKQKAVGLMSQLTTLQATVRIAAELLDRRRLSDEEVSLLVDIADGVANEAEYSAHRTGNGRSANSPG